MFPPRASFNASWFINGNLVPLVEKFCPAGWSAWRGKPVMHIDNAPARNSRMTPNFFGHNLLKELLNPTYSPNISPPHFDLFGKVRIALIGREIPDEIDFLESVTQILNGIADDELQCVFRSWIERVERVIDARVLFDGVNILIFPVSFHIDSFMASRIICWTP
jgi:hypothetical protein